MSNKTEVNGGVGFAGLLTFVFITLKLTGVIAWSWWWVVSPIWIPVVVALLVIVIASGVTAWGAAKKKTKGMR